MRPIIVPLALAAALLAACGGGGTSPTPTASPEATPSAPAATTTVTTPRSISGMFTDPRPSPADETRRLGPLPETFPVWNGTSTMIYDVRTGTATDLGTGALGRFSPDSTRMVWIAGMTGGVGGGEAWMIDLRTMEKRDLGPGGMTGFVDDSHVGVTRPSSNTTDIIDLATDQRTPVSGIPFYPDFLNITTPDGNVLRRSGLDPDQDNGFTLADASGATLLQFNAAAAVPAGHGSIAVATTAVPVGPADGAGYRHATTNIFLIDVETGEATFIATGSVYLQFPLVADDDYLAWTDNYCDGGHTRVYDRRNKRITEIEASLWPLAMVDGVIFEGPFGGRALIDPATLEYRAALPPGVGDASWSPDHRYGSLGQYGGHGGLCN